MKALEQSAQERVQAWIENFVSTKHPRLGDLPPCPYARATLIADKIHWSVNTTNDNHRTLDLIDQATLPVLQQEFEVAIVIHTDFKSWSVTELNDFVTQWRQKNKSRDIYLLRDHPEDLEVVAGVPMNQGDYLLFFIQGASRLFAAREELKEKGYYHLWSDLEKNMLFDESQTSERTHE